MYLCATTQWVVSRYLILHEIVFLKSDVKFPFNNENVYTMLAISSWHQKLSNNHMDEKKQSENSLIVSKLSVIMSSKSDIKDFVGL